MRFFTFLMVILTGLMTSCSSPKHYANHPSKKNQQKIGTSQTSKAEAVIGEAEKYLGTPYRFGGNDRKGLDCSGLMKLSFSKINLNLPRVSREQASIGRDVRKSQILPGDLVFFANSGGRKITHVGLVTKVSAGEIYFIHSSTSKGVMISKLNNVYWYPRYVKARRVL